MAHVEIENDDICKQKSSGRGRFSTTEKILLLVAVCGFFLCVSLLVGLGLMVSHYKNCNKTSDKLQKREVSLADSAENPRDVLIENNNNSSKKTCLKFCHSPSCQSEGLFFLNNIDESIDPCDDFYQFACGNFIKNAVIPDDNNKIDLSTITQKKIITELIADIEDEVHESDLNAFKKIKNYYKNCMNETRVRDEGTETLIDTLNGLGGWPVILGNAWKEDEYFWPETIDKLIDYGFPILFPTSVYVGVDPKNSTRNVIKILNTITRISQTYLLDGPNSKVLKAYYDYMVDIAVMLGANRDVAMEEMKQCLNFEINLYKIKSSTVQIMNSSVNYNPRTIKNLSDTYPSIPFKRILNKMLHSNGVTLDDNEIVILNDINFIPKFVELIANTPKKVIANYLLWQVVYDTIDYLPDDFLDRQLDYSRIVQGVDKRESRSNTCMEEIMENFSIGLSALYVRKHFNKESKHSVQDLVSNLKRAFEKMLREVDWMDNVTRQAALDKLNAMEVLVGYSDELFDNQKIEEYYQDLNIEYGSYLKSAFNASLFAMKKKFKGLKEPVQKQDWTLSKNAAIVNAYYYLYKNVFEIPAGFLRGSFFRYDRPTYLNYGTIGTIIGHEITHGFDINGRKINKDGNEEDWWEANTKKQYIEKANCFVDQYKNYVVKEVGFGLNGKRTQSENIADNGGYKIAYHAYDDWVRENGEEPCLPGLKYTARQMFWISAASNWCRKQKVEDLRDVVSRDSHSPARARVVVPLANAREFARDFNCALGTKMNPKNKCVVW